jgi:DNA-binding NarL/FixJ family response regulator
VNVDGEEPLVGRRTEQARLQQFVASVKDRARALVLLGPAGCGKTALWSCGIRLAGRNARVLTCRPGELATRVSYSGLAELLGGMDAELGRLTESDHRALLTAVRRERAPVSGTDIATVALAASRVLDAAAADGLVVAVDDLHWLDPSSLRVIAFALRRLGERPIGLLATQRGDNGLDVLRPALAPDRTSLLTVGPLEESETDELIRRRLGAALLRPLVAQIHQTAGGNPLFSLELARGVLQQTSPLRAGVPLPLPNTLRELMGRRVAATSARTREVLMVVAAAAGCTVDTVECALGTSALPAVQRAIDAGLLESERGELRFTHPLLAAESYAAADPARRRRMHLRLATLSSDVEEQARHLSAATELPDPVIADRLDAGAAAAYARGAPDAAGVLAERALHLTPETDHEATVRRTIAAADYFWEIGASAKCIHLLRRLADQLPRGAEHADALRRLAAAISVSSTYGEAKSLLDLAIAEAGDDPALLGALHCERAFDVMQADDVRASRADAEAAVSLAERSGDPELLADAEATYLLQAVIGADVSGDVQARLHRLAALPDTGHRWGGITSRFVLVAAMLKWLDDFDAARALLTEVYTDVWNRQLDGILLPALFQLSELECWAGRLDRARELAERGRDTQRRSQRDGVAPMWMYPAALAAARSGRHADAERLASASLAVAERVSEGRHRMRALAVLGFVALSTGDAASAVGYLDRVEKLQQDLGYAHPAVIRSDADHIEALIITGELSRAEHRLAVFHHQVQRTHSPWATVTELRCRGLLHAATGRNDAASDALRAAAASRASVPDPLEQGRTLLAQGELLRRTGHRSDACGVLTQAHDLLRSAGAEAWAVKAAAELDRARSRGRSAAPGLTPMERRISQLVADGKPNKEIAAVTYLSPKTVEAHLSSIYRKLGLRSRTELTARVLSERHETKS